MFQTVSQLLAEQQLYCQYETVVLVNQKENSRYLQLCTFSAVVFQHSFVHIGHVFLLQPVTFTWLAIL